MRKLVTLVAALVLAWPFVALGDASPDSIFLGPTGSLYTLCSAQSGTGDCTRGGDEIVLDTGAFSSVSIVSVGSTGTYSCDIVGNNTGHDAASGSGQTLNSVALSSTQLAITLTETPRYIWATCSANSGAVTITVLGRRIR